MIREDYVSFETAKLLKEKGFDMSCEYLGYNIFDSSHRQDTIENFSCSEAPHLYIPTISQARAMKWLREVHDLAIQIELIDFLEHGEVWLYSVIKRKTIKQLTGRDEDFTEHSYEEACEAAIKYCLENLI